MNKQTESKESIFLVSCGDWYKRAFKSKKDAYTQACWCLDDAIRLYIEADDETFDIFDDAGCFLWDYDENRPDDTEFSKRANTMYQVAKRQANCFEKYEFYNEACNQLWKYDEDDGYSPIKEWIDWPNVEEIELVSILGKKKIKI